MKHEKFPHRNKYEKIQDVHSVPDSNESNEYVSILTRVDIQATLRWHKAAAEDAAKKANNNHSNLSSNRTALMGNPQSRFDSDSLFIGVIILDGYSRMPGLPDLNWVLTHGFSYEHDIKIPIKDPAFVAQQDQVKSMLEEKFKLCSVNSGIVYLFEMKNKTVAELEALICTQDKILDFLNTNRTYTHQFKKHESEWEFIRTSQENLSVLRDEKPSSRFTCTIM